MANLMGSFVRCRISVSNSLAALADAKLSITATPSSPMTKPPFAAATPFAAGLSIAAHTFAPTCFSVNGGTGGEAQIHTGSDERHRRLQWRLSSAIHKVGDGSLT
jgi:hypothetical protein